MDTYNISVIDRGNNYKYCIRKGVERMKVIKYEDIQNIKGDDRLQAEILNLIAKGTIKTHDVYKCEYVDGEL